VGENWRTAEKNNGEESLLNLIDVSEFNEGEQPKRRLRTHRRRFNSLTSGTKPGTEARAMRPRLMAGVMRSMGHAGRGHEPVHQNETDE